MLENLFPWVRSSSEASWLKLNFLWLLLNLLAIAVGEKALE